ncbi:MAG: hypothetical protein ACTSWW_00035 [Promethearchaeota archaeon]
MPRSADKRKLNHARELLKTDLSINDIREQLTTIYGSAISPNKLLEERHKLAPKKKGFSLFPKKPSGESSQDLSQFGSYNSLLKDIDRKLENHISLIFKKLELQDMTHTREITQEIKNLRKKTAEANFFQHYNNVKIDILDFLTHRTIPLKQIVHGLELSEELTKLVLADLENSSQLLVSVDTSNEVLYHKMPKDYLELHASFAEVAEDPLIQLEIEEIKDALDDPLRELRSQLILKGKDESLIYVALEQLVNKWKNRPDD